MLVKNIIYDGQAMELRCDGKCSKAWGLSSRPHIDLDPKDDDDRVWLADHEIEGDASQ